MSSSPPPRPRPPRTRQSREERQRELRRRRRRAGAALAIALVALIAIVYSAFAGGGPVKPGPETNGQSEEPPEHRAPPRTFGAGVATFHFVDSSRTVLVEGQDEPRTLETVVYYPTNGGPSNEPVSEATPAATGGPFPLIVFGHGFEKTPQVYQPLLEYWARHGFVVAAPVFPLENKDAPGGPNESDLPNEPQDISFVITSMIEEAQRGTGAFTHVIDTQHIGVSGHSDGGDAALAAAYDPALRDSRISAAAILSGAEIPMLGPFTFPSSGPALLAVQGTADHLNKPAETYAYFAQAPKPKYLLKLIGARHLPPYTIPGPQLETVRKVTLQFFDAYLKGDQKALQELQSSENLGSPATLTAEP